MSEGPTIRRGQSSQDIETPDEFMAALNLRFGFAYWDLAATDANHKAPQWITPEQDSLTSDWSRLTVANTILTVQHPLLWLNPPFDPVEPWVAKCAEESQRGARILLLCRASVDSNWWWQYIQPHAVVYALTPRIKFVGAAQGYPSSLCLCTYNVLGVAGGPIQRWRWK